MKKRNAKQEQARARKEAWLSKSRSKVPGAVVGEVITETVQLHDHPVQPRVRIGDT